MIKAVIFDCYGVLVGLDAGTPNEELFAYIRDVLKPKYKVGMLSNVNSNKLSLLFDEEQLRLFDATALSFEIGAVKPDVAAYEAAAALLGVEPSECVFVDDIESYAAASELTGMKAIWHMDTSDTITKLGELLSA
jgi:FMN phosphatase YigB (HAD superfamily)